MGRTLSRNAVRIWVVVGAVVLLPLAACGGGDDSTGAATDSTEAPTDEAPTDQAPADTDEAPAETDEAPAETDEAQDAADEAADDAADPGDFDFGTGVARVTIGDTDYEFDLTSGFTVCQDIFGGLQVAGENASGDANVDMWIPPVDWETYTDGRYDPPSVIVEDDTANTRWIADPGRVELISDWPPESRVDSYTKDGNAATGSATFVDDYAIDAVEPVPGTFEVACES